MVIVSSVFIADRQLVFMLVAAAGCLSVARRKVKRVKMERIYIKKNNNTVLAGVSSSFGNDVIIKICCHSFLFY